MVAPGGGFLLRARNSVPAKIQNEVPCVRYGTRWKRESQYIAIAVSRHFLPDLGPPRMAGFFAQARDKFRKTVAAAHVLRIAGCCHHRFQPARLTSVHWPGSACFRVGCVPSRRNPCKAGSNEDRPCRWPAIYCPRAFLVRTRGGVDLRIAQRRACRRRRRRCFLRDWPFVVRVAVVQDSLPPIGRHMTARPTRTHRRAS